MSLAADLVFYLVTGLWLMLPAYLANMLAVVVGGGRPIDGGRNWRDGRRIMGYDNFEAVHWGQTRAIFLIAYAMGFGALAGDAIESFFKRRTGRERGQPWVPFDQLDFVVGSLLFGFVVALLLEPTSLLIDAFTAQVFRWPRVAIIIVVTPLLHFAVNVIGYWLKLKKEPW